MIRAGLFAVVVMSSGCASLISEGQVGDRPVRLDGTAFAWLDETVYEPSGGRLVLKPRDSDDVVLRVFFSAAVFDPAVDLFSLPLAERQRVYDDVARSDRLELYVRRGDRIAPGDELRFDSAEVDVPQAGPYLSRVDLSLGSTPLERDADYPDQVDTLARLRTATLQVNELTPRVLGDVDVNVRQSGEGDTGSEGHVSVRFDIERVSERIAECNWAPDGAGSGVRPCDELSFSAE